MLKLACIKYVSSIHSEPESNPIIRRIKKKFFNSLKILKILDVITSERVIDSHYVWIFIETKK